GANGFGSSPGTGWPRYLPTGVETCFSGSPAQLQKSGAQTMSARVSIGVSLTLGERDRAGRLEVFEIARDDRQRNRTELRDQRVANRSDVPLAVDEVHELEPPIAVHHRAFAAPIGLAVIGQRA